VSDKDDKRGEITKELADLNKHISYEMQLPYHKRDHKRLEKLREEWRALRSWLKRLDKE